MRINVTQSDINNGLRYTSNSCPIALAVGRAIGKEVEITFETCSVYEMIGDFWRWVPYRLPIEVSEFIDQFDDELPVAPLEFEFNFE